MGLLDDAIREHLELKRRHGADPHEVARQEDEALGPIGGHEPRPAPARDDERDDEYELDEPIAPYEEPAAAVHDDQLELTDVGEEEAEEPAHELREPERHPRDAPETRPHTIEYSIEDEHAAEVPPAAPEPRATEPRERRAPEPREPALEPAEPAEPADELEETPEFLQETPEHDRLWFEQKPPRDFDF